MSKSVRDRLSTRFTNMEPPDKRRRMEDGKTSEAIWDDDDLDQFLTQDNLNVIDNLVMASQQVKGSHKSVSNEKERTDCYVDFQEKFENNFGASVPENPNSLMSAGVARSSLLPPNLFGFGKKTLGSGSVGATGSNSKNFCVSSMSTPAPVVENGSNSCLPQNFYKNGSSMDQRCPSAVDSAAAVSGTGEAVHSSANTGSEAISPALPNSSAQVTLVDATRILEECQNYKTECKKLKESQYTKDGEIKILRQKCDQAQTDLNRKNLEMARLLNQKTAEKSKREADLASENEKLKAQLQFRQQEASEMKNQLKRLERRCNGDVAPLSDSLKSPIAGLRSHSRSPVASKSPSLATTKRPDVGNFPSPQSFLAQNVAPFSQSNNKLTGREGNSGTNVKKQKMKLNLSRPNGIQTGPHLINGVLQQELSGLLSNSCQLPFSCALVKQNSHLPCTQSCQKPASVSHRLPTNESQKIDSALSFAHAALESLLSVESQVLSVGTAPSVLLLPLVEETLTACAAFLQNQKKSPTSTSGGLLSAVRLSQQSISDSGGLPLGNSSGSDGDDSAPDALRSLTILLHLVQHCEHSRAVICGTGCTNSDTVQMNQLSDAVISMSISRIENDCQLIELLTYLANPVHTHTYPQLDSVPVLCLSIFRILLQNCTEDKCSRFLPLLKSDCISQCLTNRHGFALPFHALALISSAVCFQSVVRGLCSFGDKCLLALVIQFCTQETFDASWTSAEVNSIHQKMVFILGRIVRLHYEGSHWLATTNCQCSSMVVKGLLRVICDQYCSYSSNSNAVSLDVIRHGVGILHFLAADNKAFVVESFDPESDYHLNIANVRKLFKSHSEIPDQEDEFWFTLSEVLPLNCSSDEETTTGDKAEDIIELEK